MAPKPPAAAVITPDGRYIVVDGRLWRATNPSLGEARRKALVQELMTARRAIARATKAGDNGLLKQARAAVHAAKVKLGERGRVWWSDGAPDYNRHLAKNTPYATWYAGPTQRKKPARKQAVKLTVPVFLMLTGAAASTQSIAQVSDDCPTVLIAASAEVNGPAPALFQASAKGGSAEVDAAYNWSVSAGTIVAGQGTSQIVVDTNGLAAGTVIHAMVQVLGYPGSCDTSASAAMTVVKAQPGDDASALSTAN